MGSSITIKELANKLGVSTSTVSRILNGKNTSNADLVDRVKEMAKKYNYQVNTAALGLRTNKTKLIGIIVPEINNDFFASILSGMEQVAEREGYNLLICQSNESREKELKLVKSLLSCNVEGVMISISEQTEDTELLELMENSGKKLVFFDRIFRQNSFPNITFNDFEGAYQAGRHLIELGRRSFLYLGVSEKVSNNQDRLAGFNAALKKADLPAARAEYVHSSNVVEFTKEISNLREIDALLCYNDLLATEAMVAIKGMGMRIPEDVAVCGFDNRFICELVSPTLSSVTHATEELGSLAASTLLHMLQENDEPIKDQYIDASLIVRESTGSGN